jgi:hypothetical protein
MSGDGRFIYFMARDPQTNVTSRLIALDTTTGERRQLVTDLDGRASVLGVSPQGDWILASIAGGTERINLTTGERVVVPVVDAVTIGWTRDGRPAAVELAKPDTVVAFAGTAREAVLKSTSGRGIFRFSL